MNSTETISVKASLFLKRLREDTSPLHLALEADTLMSSLTDPGLNIHKYQAYLAIMGKVVSYFEKNIQARAASFLTDWAPHPSLVLIREDLETVEKISGAKMSVAEFSPEDPSISDHAALGFLYVMEGSKLGGRVIFKQVKRHLGMDELHGAKYLADHGSDTLDSWKRFLHEFSFYIAESNGEEQAISGANLAFQSISAFFALNKALYEF